MLKLSLSLQDDIYLSLQDDIYIYVNGGKIDVRLAGKLIERGGQDRTFF